MQYRVLGSLEVVGPGGPVALGGPKPRALVALLLAVGRPLPIGEVVSELWPDPPPPSAAATLHSYVSRLRRQLPEGTLVTAQGTYALHVEPGALDRDAFVGALAAGAAASGQADDEGAVAHLTAALSLWRGPALPELVDSPRGRAEADRLAELRRTAAEDRAEAALRLGRHVELVAELEAAVAEEPLRERRWAQLVLALYRSGRQADALRRCHELRSILAEELGIDPGPEMAGLERAVLVQSPDLDHVDPRPARAPARAGTPAPLPSPLSRFIGRGDELDAVRDAVAASRLVTVVGPGGVGKTRLSTEVASDGSQTGRRLVAFVDLVGLEDPALVPAAVAAAFGVDVPEGSTVGSALAGSLGGQEALLVLDNCEHLVEACAATAADLLVEWPELRILATSREPLDVVGETIWRLAPLADDDAEALLRDRTGQAARGWDTATATQLCRRLDGLPLAIELAASRLRSMSPTELSAALDERFRVLSGGSRTAPARQRSLRAVLEWSFELLEPDDRRLLAVTSAFAGTFDAAATAGLAGAVSGGDAIDVAVRLARLADRSLVQVVQGGRYRLLESVRELAAEDLAGLGVARSVHAAHARWFHALARDAREGLQGAAQRAWLDRCELDVDGFRSAMEWATANGEAEVAIEIGTGLQRFWVTRRAVEGRRLIEAALAVPGEPSAARALGYERAGALAEHLGDIAGTERLERQALALARAVGDRDVEALALNELGKAAHADSRLEEAVELGRQAVAVARDGAGETTTLSCLTNLAGTYLEAGSLGEARALYEEVLTIVRRTGDAFSLAVVLHNLGVVALQEGAYVEARASGAAALRINEEIGNDGGRATNYDLLAQACLRCGDLAAAEEHSSAGVRLVREMGPPRTLSITLGTLAEIVLARGGDAGPVLEEKLALDRVLGFTPGTATALELQARLLAAQGDPAAAADVARRAVETARRSGFDLVLAEALTTAGSLERVLGRPDRAVPPLREALALWRAASNHPGSERCLDELRLAGVDVDAPAPTG